MKSRLNLTPPYPCSYLDDQQARSAFVSPGVALTPQVYNALIQHGFRRSGNHVYRPQCDACSACESLRVLVPEFEMSRSQRRVMRRNRDLITRLLPAKYTDERYALFERYLEHRHSDGDMYPTNPQQFEAFLLSGWCKTFFLDMRLEGTLIGCAVIDDLPSGLSAVYSFFDPTLDNRSLGTFAVLWQLATAKRLGLPYVYLGYQVDACKKMLYKSNFTPHERFAQGVWTRQ